MKYKGRRDFLRKVFFGSILAKPVLSNAFGSGSVNKHFGNRDDSKGVPLIISTWNHGIGANKAAWEILKNGGTVLDCVEQGVRVPEADPNNLSVGYGGLPDREGNVTLDASIMDSNGLAGAVGFLEHIKHPISVARKVMEDTPHVMMVGEGALKFALSKGFKKENLLTKKAKKRWEKWLKKSEYKPIINVENHDTIGLLAMDREYNMAGACTTSGLSWKMRGRVGDSPLIGSGLFLDNEVGAATATGLGEAIIRVSASSTIVELMRHNYSPKEACRELIDRIYKKNKNSSEFKNLQVGLLAINKSGEYGAFSLRKGFNYAVYDSVGGNRMLDSDYMIEWD